MQIVFLGTAAGKPSINRNVSCIALDLLLERQSIWLFDCGEGSQRQLQHSNLKASKLENIFITHLHGDHVFGLAPLLSSLSLAGNHQQITVYGPIGIKQLLQTSLELSQTHLQYKLNIIEIQPGVIMEDDSFVVKAYLLKHRCTSFAFRVTEKDRPGSLLIDKIKQQNIANGPWLKQLKKGHNITLDDGQTLIAKDYLSAPIAGKIITIFGDTEITDNHLLAAANADVVVHEATYASDLADKAQQYGHSTSQQTAIMAKQAGAKKLIITHISTRYNRNDCVKLLAQCKQEFSNSFIAEDFAIFDV